MTRTRDGRDLLLQFRNPPDPTLTPALDEARFRGHQGGIIAQHRGLATEPRTWGKRIANWVLATGVIGLWAVTFDPVTVLWTRLLDFWQQVFGLDGYAIRLQYEWGLKLPYLGFLSEGPSRAIWVAGLVLTVALVVASLLVPRRLLPLSTGLRVVAFFQACAQVFFAFWPEHFPYSGAGYVHGMLIAGLFFIGLVPFIFGFTWYVFDVGWWRKLGLTLLVMVHLIVFVPLQFMAHAVLIYHSSTLFLPVLFFAFGLPLDILIFIAFYGWGASWPTLWERRTARSSPVAAAEPGGSR